MRQLEHSEHVPSPHHGRWLEVALIDLKDPLNVGQAFRLSSALGVRLLHLCGTTPAPPSAKLNRTARGAQYEVPFVQDPVAKAFESFRQNQLRIIGIEAATGSVDIRSITLEAFQPSVLLLGNEAHGLSADILGACDVVAHLPMQGKVSSYNVSTALALALWELVR